MEFFGALLPFLLVGIVAAFVSRYSGIAISFLVAPAILALGAQPAELIAFMLTFLVYHNFTMETQNARLDFKHLILFGGYKKYAVLAFVLVLSVIFPIVAVGIFLFCFIMELAAYLYVQQPPKKRPDKKKLVFYGLIMSLTTAIGVILVKYIPASVYYYIVGVGILILTGFAWYAGKRRGAFYHIWLYIWSVTGILLGLCGIEGTAYLKGLNRNYTSKEDYMYGIVTMAACFVGLMMIFLVFHIYSVPALVAAVGAGFAIRFFGVYEYTNGRSSFSLLAIALAVIAVLTLFVAEPKATGFGALNQLLNMKI